MALNTALPSLVSAIFFYISAGHYEKFRAKLEVEKDDAQTKASNYHFEEGDSCGDYGFFKENRHVKGLDHNSQEGGSYKFVHRKTFGVVEVKGRDASNSV